MKLSHLLKCIEHTLVAGPADPSVEAITYDSRKCSANSLFVAINGFKQDGQRFIEDAIARGCTTIVAEAIPSTTQNRHVTFVEVSDARYTLAKLANCFYDYPANNLKLIGITGTNGKTTTSFLVDAILKSAGFTTGLIGTVCYRIGETTLPATRTTPESSDLIAMLSEMHKAGVTHVTLEVSSHALDLKRVNGLDFKVGILTNISQDHLDFHGNMHAYQESKTQLFLLMAAQKTPGTAIINGDQAAAAEVAKTIRTTTKLPTLLYGVAETADYKATQIDYSATGSEFQFSGPGIEQQLSCHLPGHHNVENCLAAVAAAHQLGLTKSQIATGVKSLHYVPGRLQRLKTSHEVTVYVDYAHTDHALDNVLAALESIRKSAQKGEGRIITVFGCGGDRDRAKRPLMGAAAIRRSDITIVTSDNPRSEAAAQIIADIVKSPQIEEALHLDDTNTFTTPVALIEQDRRQAIRLALKLAKKQDLLLIAGKGHEDYQEVQGKKHPFDDLTVAKESIAELGWTITSA